MEWFFELEQSNKVVIILFVIGAAWGGIRLYANSVKPKHSPPPEPTQIIRFTIDEYEARKKASIAVALKEREHATGKDLEIKNAQISELRNDLANIEQSFEKQKQFIAGLEAQLVREGNTIGGDALEEATQALEAGDTTLAQSLFEEVKARTAPDVQASARASFALGEIAEQEIRWQEAFAHYSEAARLHPNFDHLIHAQKMALQIASYSEALSLAKMAMNAAVTEKGEDSWEYGAAVNNFASALKATGKFKQAEKFYRMGVENAKISLKDEDAEYGTRFNNLAELLKAMGRYEEAEPLYCKALENARVSVGEDHPDYGIRLGNLAGLLEATGRLVDAESLYRQALGIAQATLGERHSEYGRCLNNLAGLVFALGRYEEAEALCLLASENALKMLGSDHPNYGVAISNLAEVYRATGRYDKADQLYRKALEITCLALGPDHPQYGINLNNLAALLEETGCFEKADSHYRQAMTVLEKSHGLNHPTTQTIKVNYEHFLDNRPTDD